MIAQTSTAQRMIGTFAAHGITSGLLVQLQHLQELALAINLQGRHLIHLDLFGQHCGQHQLTLAGCPRDPGWVSRQRLASRCIAIPERADETTLRGVQAEMASAAADLMALLHDQEVTACASSSAY